ncbi:MAG: winged helix-turn-helix domain-containing protein [Terracidiphilus sp.]
MRFREFELDEERFQLMENGRPVRLERIPLELGLLLGRNPSRLVTREEIVACIWGVNHFFESDSAINTAMRKLRKALRDDAAHPRLIETVPGKGYRFIGGSAHDKTPIAVSAPDPEAVRCFLRGRHAWNQKTARDYEVAIDWFRQAIDRDAAFAPPLVGLAYCYLTMAIHGLKPAAEVYPRARAAAQAALEIDRHQAEAITALAEVAKGYDHEFALAEAGYLRVLQLNPDYAVAHQWYANLLSITGRHEEAIREAHLARQCDPLSVGTTGFVGYTLYRARLFNQALEECRRTVEFHNAAPLAAWFLALALLATERAEEAEAHLEHTFERSHGAGMHLALLGFARARLGRREEARATLRELEEAAKHRYVSPVDLATVHLGLGEREQAVVLLQRAIAERVMRVTELPMPLYDDVSSDPRLAKFARGLRSA